MKRVIVYCATGYAERVFYSLDDRAYEVVAYCDTNPELWGKVRGGGISVISPETLPELDYDAIIISRDMYAKEITEYLVKEIRVPPEKIEVYLPETPFHYAEERIVMLRKCIDMLKARGVQGDLAELGVYQGELARILNHDLPERKLHLFDTFEGFAAGKDEVRVADRDKFKDTNVDLVLGKMRTPENCIVHQGYFPETAEGVEATFALVSLDPDLYEPTLSGLRYFWPRLAPGGYIFIHDYDSNYYTGVKKAVTEFLGETHAVIVPVADICGSVIIAK